MILINHVGFLCNARKRFIVKDSSAKEFEIQDMGRNSVEALRGRENWIAVYKGALEIKSTPMGDFLTGDFSSISAPGVYRVVLPETDEKSYQFVITDGAYSRIPRMLLDFVHERRSGDFENDWRMKSHLDDGVRSDTGEHLDAIGGWYDAGDLRKWMTHATQPAIGFIDFYERLSPAWNHFADENVSPNDLITETIWGVRFILKMQEKSTGMFFEDVGGGGNSRAGEGLSWWYENHSGCYADNAMNYFTDNISGTQDDRIVRTTYNPIVQYVNQYILLRAADHIRKYDPSLAERSLQTVKDNFSYVESIRATDPMHGWTSVRSWRLLTGIELCKKGIITETIASKYAEDLLSLYDDSIGYWFNDESKSRPYRGLIHSAQPLIALCTFCSAFPQNALNYRILALINDVITRYVTPMLQTNPFGIMPYGLYAKAETPNDLYRPFAGNLLFRFFMPDHSAQKVNHGLSAHWTSWAHALALASKITGDDSLADAAFDQLYWLIGGNPLDASLISGIGYNNPMPHSRFHGTIPGGICTGPRGDEHDEVVIDFDRNAEWSTVEYWNLPAANMMMALSVLIPQHIASDRKLGYVSHHQ
ncbi:MAG TPA: glycoside hydrolase family 9 protein [Spirochaetota bacterium]